MTNYVYIGTSLDGCIAAADGGVEWMNYVPIPEGDDLGFFEFMERVDAVVMGRNTLFTHGDCAEWGEQITTRYSDSASASRMALVRSADVDSSSRSLKTGFRLTSPAAPVALI